MVMSISIDKEIKDKAVQKAESDNLSLSAVIRLLLLDYANGKIQIGARMAGEVSAEFINVDKDTQKLMNKHEQSAYRK